MVKIKSKKQMNLPQLIEWAMENEIKDKMFLTKNSYCVGFDRHGYIYFNSQKTIPPNQTFTVEVEEELTEDTVIPKLLTTFETINVKNKVRYQRVRIDENYTIKLMLNITEVHREPVETLHIVNDDGTHTLIWRDGKLVE
ncbi:hypothetical protein [Staphylococcus xylosus]|uniref:hypothetical protein n=1 Tax=Staphylococcus xylosus TaxID=1288 RepID=UPI003CE671A4